MRTSTNVMARRSLGSLPPISDCGAVKYPQPGPNGHKFFEASVPASGCAKLGIEVAPVAVFGMEGLSVTKVSPGGAFDTYNQTSGMAMNIRPGDIMISVNGITSHAPGMVSELRAQQNLHLKVYRSEDDSGPIEHPNVLMGPFGCGDTFGKKCLDGVAGNVPLDPKAFLSTVSTAFSEGSRLSDAADYNSARTAEPDGDDAPIKRTDCMLELPSLSDLLDGLPIEEVMECLPGWGAESISSVLNNGRNPPDLGEAQRPMDDYVPTKHANRRGCGGLCTKDVDTIAPNSTVAVNPKSLLSAVSTSFSKPSTGLYENTALSPVSSTAKLGDESTAFQRTDCMRELPSLGCLLDGLSADEIVECLPGWGMESISSVVRNMENPPDLSEVARALQTR